MTESSITFETVTGQATLPYLPRLIELRLAFFKKYPYFYEGNLSDEENYVRLYAHSKDSLFTLAKKGQEVIGIVTGLPFSESHNENRELAAHHQIPAAQAFYIGELIVSEKSSDRHLAQKLYQQFEKSVKELTQYNTLFVCECERKDSKEHSDPFSAETRWEDKGFIKQPQLHTHFAWQEIDQDAKTDHLMVFWKKQL